MNMPIHGIEKFAIFVLGEPYRIPLESQRQPCELAIAECSGSALERMCFPTDPCPVRIDRERSKQFQPGFGLRGEYRVDFGRRLLADFPDPFCEDLAIEQGGGDGRSGG